MKDPDPTAQTTAPQQSEAVVSSLKPGQRFDRFVVLQQLGEGAMGVVYEVYDRTLDRRIALKVIRTSRIEDDASATRFMREAQALARLSHPNVVHVYDVGTVGSSTYIAMELIRGMTLDRWLKAAQRPVDEILDVMRAAGAGLASAHKAGVVHRDIKPSNVVIGDDGRVRVIDFGVARSTRAHDDTPDQSSSISLDDDAPSLDQPLTEVGELVGTPAYMAPEQLRGGAVDERTDQFSFAVTAYQALFGERPYPRSRSVALRLEAIARGPGAPPKSAPPVSRHVRRVLTRALASAPADRYPSMEELLDDLRRDPARTLRRTAIAVLVLAAAGTAIALVATRAATRDPCATAAAPIDDTWSPSTRAGVQKAFTATGHPRAAETFEHTDAAFDRYALAWRTMRVEACRATHIHHTQSAALLDARMACLDRHLGAMRELIAIDRAATRETVDRAVDAVIRLPSFASCADAQSLTARVPLPRDPTARARVERGQATIARAEALGLFAHFEDGRAAIEEALPEIRATQFPPLIAEALLDLSNLHDKLRHDDRARTIALEAVEQAALSGDPVLEARIWSYLVWIAARQHRYGDLELLYRAAHAALMRAGDPPLERAALLHAIGKARLGTAERSRGLADLREALTIRERELPADNIEIARNLDDVSYALALTHRENETVEPAERGLAIRERIYGPNHPEVAMSYRRLARAHGQRGEMERAVPPARRAVEIFEQALGPNNPDVSSAYFMLALVLSDAGDQDAAMTALERARTSAGSDAAPGTVYGGSVQYALGMIQLARGNLAAARTALKQSIDDYEKAGTDIPDIADALELLGEVELAAHNATAASSALQRARAAVAQDNLLLRAQIQLGLARAYVESAPAKARVEAEAGRRVLAGEPGYPKSDKLRAEIDAWLAKHP